MARVILNCVGSRDPYWGRESTAQLVFSAWKEKHPSDYATAAGAQKGPVLSFLDSLSPPLGGRDKLVLISTRAGPEVRDPSEGGGNYTVEEIRARHPEVEVIHKVMNPQPGGRDARFNPALYEEVLPRMRGILQEILTGANEDEYLVMYSSGTPQMQAAWCVLVNAGLLPAKLYRAEGDEVGLAPLFEEQAITQAISMVRAGAFRAAATVLHDLEKKAITKDRRGMARFMSEICEGYDLWARFAYEGARDRIAKAQEGLTKLRERIPALPEWDGFLPLVEKQEKALDACRPGQPALGRVLHLLHLARHESAAGDHQTGLWQYCSVVELVIVDRACQALLVTHGIEVDPTRYRDSLQLSKEALAGLYGGGSADVPQWLEDSEGLRVLRRLRPQEAETLDSEEVRNLRSWRNGLLHRQRQVTANDTYRADGVVKRAIQDIYNVDNLDEHAFSFETMQLATGLMERLLLEST